MKGLVAFAVLVIAATVVTVARSGHEFPVYPSYYPHEIRIATVSPERAAGLLAEGKIQAYIGAEPRFASTPKDPLHAVESLGSLVVVRVNPESPLIKDHQSACTIVQGVAREIAQRRGEMTFHPYPITPFDGDYLYHVDLAEAAKARLASVSTDAAAPATRNLKLRAPGALVESLVPRDRQAHGSQWDAAVTEVSVADLTAFSMFATNGWLGPPWVKTGWFRAALVLADSIDDPTARDRVQADLGRLESGSHEDAALRINLERELVTRLAASCRAMVVGYTVKREYVSTEYSLGIENIGFDSIEGLNSPIFIRTAKLKDFPWNGWLSLGTDGLPAAAWNPIAGFTDKFGRLMWAAVGDPAMIPTPNDARWILNRTSDVQANQSR